MSDRLGRIDPLGRSYVLALIQAHFPDFAIGNTFPGLDWTDLSLSTPAVIYVDDDNLVTRQRSDWISWFNPDNIHLVTLQDVHDTLISHGIKSVLFPYLHVLEDAISLHYINDPDLFSLPVPGSCSYFCLNRNRNPERQMLLSALITQNLLQHGMVTARWMNHEQLHKDQYLAAFDEHSHNGAERHCEQHSGVAITGSLKNFIALSQHYYPLISIIAETSLRAYKPTEKCVSAFIMGRIPLLLAQTGRIAELRQQGFDMFDDIIDNAHDAIADPESKIKQSISNNLSRLTTPTEINDHVRQRLAKNQQHFAHGWMWARINELISAIKSLHQGSVPCQG